MCIYVIVHGGSLGFVRGHGVDGWDTRKMGGGLENNWECVFVGGTEREIILHDPQGSSGEISPAGPVNRALPHFLGLPPISAFIDLTITPDYNVSFLIYWRITIQNYTKMVY